MKVYDKIIDYVFKNSFLFNTFRKIVHHDYKVEKDVIRKEIVVKDNEKILDFGCGIGQYSILFNEKNYHGMDMDEKYIDFAKKNFKGEFILNKVKNKIDFKDNTFNYIIAFALFHHVPDDDFKEIVKEFNRVLKKNGKVLVMDPLPVKYQKTIFGKIMVKIDRGKFARDIETLSKEFSKYFKIEKNYLIKTGPYTEYILLLSK